MLYLYKIGRVSNMIRISDKEKNKAKLFILLFILALTVCIFEIKTTYAKYITSTNGESLFNVARWKIILNDYDITKEQEISKWMCGFHNFTLATIADISCVLGENIIKIDK